MVELTVEVPAVLERESNRLRKESEELISAEEKRKRLSVLIDEVMEGAKQLSDAELVKFGGAIKEGRSQKVRQMELA